MPLLPVKKHLQGLLYIWHLTEKIKALETLSFQDDILKSLKYRKIEHRKHFLAKQIILRQNNYFSHLKYLSTGKPVLENGQFISITHSGAYVVVTINPYPIGIDLEQEQPKLQNVSPKFVHSKDYFVKSNHENPYLWLWTAKESIYKLIGQKGLSLKKDIIIENIDVKKLTGHALVFDKININLFYQKITPSYILCTARSNPSSQDTIF